MPPAAKFIRFYPVTFHSSKALRVEVYGSKQGWSLSTYPIQAVQKTTTALKNLRNKKYPDTCGRGKTYCFFAFVVVG